MIVTATNTKYFFYLIPFLKTLFKFGRVKQSEVCVIVFGSRYECKALHNELIAIFPKISTLIADLGRPEFKFLSMDMEAGHWALVTDYLRAWAGKKYARYVWMDTDILVRSSIRELFKLNKFSEKIAMAPCFDPLMSLDHEAYVKAYSLMFLKAFGKRAKIDTNEDGHFVVRNSGVILINRNYSTKWREHYLKVKDNKKVRKLLRKSPDVLGQGIWNIIYWNQIGEPLPDTYNHLVGIDLTVKQAFEQDKRSKGLRAWLKERESLRKFAAVCHYAGYNKERYWKDFIFMRYLKMSEMTHCNFKLAVYYK